MDATNHLPPLSPREPIAFGPSKPLVARPGPPRRLAAGCGGGQGGSADAAHSTVNCSWAHAHAKYFPNEARAEAEAAVLDARRESARQFSAAMEAERRAEATERRAREAQDAAKRDVREVGYAFEQMALEYEERIQALEDLLEEERRAHRTETRRLEQANADAEEVARRRVEEAQARCDTAVAAAEARAAAAERESSAAAKRATAQVEEARARAAARVEEVRRLADHRAVAQADQNRLFIDQARAAVLATRCGLNSKVPTFTTYA